MSAITSSATTTPRNPEASTELVKAFVPSRSEVLSPEDLEALEIHVRKSEADARKSIAQRLVLAYIILLAFSVVIPTAVMWIPNVTATSVTDARDLMLAMSGSLSGLVGILGFVMGYYFKSLDKSPEATAPRVESAAPSKRSRSK